MKKLHFLGIGGSGASAIAKIAQSQGYEVTGCDKIIDNEFTQDFDKSILFQGHSPEHLEGFDILVITPAITTLDPHNPELEEAKKKNIPILTWQQFMGEELEKDKFVIAVCGTHGKSTTTAMIGQLLEDIGSDPTVELGAIVPKWEANYLIGKGKYFVTEADEFNDNFLPTHPDVSIVTTIEMDHPEYFEDFGAVKESFTKFLAQTKQTIVANLEDEGVAHVVKDVMKLSNVSALDYTKTEVDLDLKIPGKYNLLNAKAVFQTGLILGVEPLTIIKSLNNFSGIGRRFEYLGKFKKADVYSDFGHHPTEIKVTLETARQKFPDKRLICIFQPHMFSRTKYLFDDFVKVFRTLPVDRSVIIDIYPSREVDTGMVKSEQLVTSIAKENVEYNSPEALKETLLKEAENECVLFFVGAGDIDAVARNLVGK